VATRIPAVKVNTDGVTLGGGLDLISGPYAAKPGTCRYASNYESIFGGGYESKRGHERFDGRPRPSDAVYTASVPTVAYTSVVVGNTVTGFTSGVTGKVIYVGASYIALTRMTGVFTVGETLKVGGTTIGIHSVTDAVIDGFQDNILYALAAAEYRTSIAAVTGSGDIRGVAVLGSTIYAWRNNVGATAMEIYKSAVGGWTLVPLGWELGFDTGTDTAFAEGATVYGQTSGATGVVARVAQETAAWVGGSGRLILSSVTGTFASPENLRLTNGAGVTKAHAAGAQTAITIPPNGRVEYDVFNFTGSTDTKRIYGCDGVGREFEFDGTVYVPLTTGMGSIRASFVKAHKNALWFAYKGSLQKSAVGLPYQWSAVLGAAELATGDTITGLLSVGGSEAAAAMVVFCKDSLYVLYGSSSSDFKLTPLSFESGSNPYSVQDIGTPMAHDTPGFKAYTPTQSYGNFIWDVASRMIDPIARNQTPQASVFVKSLGRYRCFFADGSAISATQHSVDRMGSRVYAWMPIILPITVKVATSAEVGGITRTFYGASDGFVYEDDVGRSFDGAAIDCSIKLSAMHQKNPMLIKQYRGMEYEGIGRSAYTLQCSAEYASADPDAENMLTVTFNQITNFGTALVWGGANWGEAQWGAGEQSRKRIREKGQGISISPLLGRSSANELSHDLKTIFVPWSSLRMVR